MKKLILISVASIILSACTKIATPPTPVIDLGVRSSSTCISNITQKDNVITVTYDVSLGSKYSVQILPFGSDQPIKTEGFTAQSLTVIKTYDLSTAKKMNYDLIFIDMSGKEVRRPIIIK